MSLCKKRVLNCFIALLFLIVTACSSTSGPVVIRDSSTISPVTPTVSEEKKEESIQQARVQPVTPDGPVKVIPLVEKLVIQSRQEYSNKNYEQAINLAEKGLRVNRKEARLYLVLAKAYKAEKNTKQSNYFAKQGLRYAKKGEPTYSELVNMVTNKSL